MTITDPNLDSKALQKLINHLTVQLEDAKAQLIVKKKEEEKTYGKEIASQLEKNMDKDGFVYIFDFTKDEHEGDTIFLIKVKLDLETIKKRLNSPKDRSRRLKMGTIVLELAVGEDYMNTRENLMFMASVEDLMGHYKRINKLLFESCKDTINHLIALRAEWEKTFNSRVQDLYRNIYQTCQPELKI